MRNTKYKTFFTQKQFLKEHPHKDSKVTELLPKTTKDLPKLYPYIKFRKISQQSHSGI